MEKKHLTRRIVCLVLALTLATGGIALLVAGGVNAADIRYYSYNSDDPFFNYYMDNIDNHGYQLDNDTSIDRWFDTLPATTNTSNFCSLGTVKDMNPVSHWSACTWGVIPQNSEEREDVLGWVAGLSGSGLF